MSGLPVCLSPCLPVSLFASVSAATTGHLRVGVGVLVQCRGLCYWALSGMAAPLAVRSSCSSAERSAEGENNKNEHHKQQRPKEEEE